MRYHATSDALLEMAIRHVKEYSAWQKILKVWNTAIDEVQKRHEASLIITSSAGKDADE